MISKQRTVLGALLLALVVGLPSMAQNRGEAQAPNLNPVAKSPAELSAYNALKAAPTPAQMITLSDTFLTTYPNSQLIGLVLRMRMESFDKMNKSKEAADAAQKALDAENQYLDMKTKEMDDAAAAKKKDKNALDKNSPAYKTLVQQTQNDRLFYYTHLVGYSLDQQDMAKAIEWGQMTFKQQPDELQTLLMLSDALAKHPSADPNEKKEQLKNAEEWGKKGITVLQSRLSSDLGARMAPEQKNSLLASAHDTLGWVYVKTERYPEAQKEANLALASKKDDGAAYYQLGVSYLNAKPQKIDDALDSFAKSIACGGDTKQLATDTLKDIWQQKNKTMDGMDDFIVKTGAKVKP